MALAAAATGLAAGLAGIELTPDKGPTDTAPGPATAFHVRVPTLGATTSGFELRNLTDTAVTVRIYAADATRGDDGQFSVGAAAGAPWIQLTDEQVTLAGGEHRRVSFRIADPGVAVGTEAYGAVVMEVPQGSLTLRSATIVYALVGDPPQSLIQRIPWWLWLLAVAAILFVGAAQTARMRVLLRQRRRRAGRAHNATS